MSALVTAEVRDGEVLPFPSKHLTTVETDTLGEQARALHEAAERAGRDTVRHAKATGLILSKVKASLPHGMFQHWLARATGINPRTAQVYMRLARELPKLPEAKAKRVAHLSLRDAIAELSRTTTAAAKLPAPVLDKALAEARRRPVKRALVVAANRERQPTTEPTVVDKTDWTSPAPRSAPPPLSELAQGVVGHLRSYKRDHPEATDAALLEALNEAYCCVQDGALDRAPLATEADR